MNGMKLGQNQSKAIKNSFAFENEFMNYEEDDSESEEQSSQEPSLKEKKKQEKKQVKNDKETKKIQKINQDISNLSVNILDLKEKYNDLNMEEVMFKKRNEKKEAQIHDFLTQKKKQKKARQRKLKSIQTKEQKKLHQSIEMEKSEEKSRVKGRVDEELRKMIRKKQKKTMQKQKDEKNIKFVAEMYEKIKQEEAVKKKFHFRKEEEDRIKQRERRQRQKEILKKRKENYQPLQMDQLDQHQKNHEDRLAKLQENRKIRQQQQYQSIIQRNQKLDDLYRGISYDYVQEEIQDKKQRRKQPKENYKKIKKYQEYVREHFKPKTQQKPPPKSYNLSKIRNSTLSHREVKRYRYLEGVAYGEVLENRPVAKSDAEQRKMGNDYLEYLRTLPKKKKVEQQPQINPNDLELLDQRFNQIVRVKKQRNPLYEKNRRKNLEVRVSQKPTRDQVTMVIGQLKGQDEKMRMKEKILKSQINNATELSSKQKEINDEMVDNIERKLNLLAKLG